MKIVLLSGWSGSGKDTVGNSLEHMVNARLIAFADALKEIVANEAGFPLFWAYSQQGKQRRLKNGKTVRDVLVQRGQEIRAEKGDSGYFARIVAGKIRTMDANSLVVITDWRLPIELDTIQECLADIPILKVRVQRADQIQSPVKDSETETQLDNWVFDCTIHNDGKSIIALEEELRKKLIPLL